jgi:hypothetical protein
VFEMSQQSNFRNRGVVEKAGVLYRPIRHGDPRDTQTQPKPRPRCRGFFLVGGCWLR